jgi:hypothetical protein
MYFRLTKFNWKIPEAQTTQAPCNVEQGRDKKRVGRESG